MITEMIDFRRHEAVGHEVAQLIVDEQFIG